MKLQQEPRGAAFVLPYIAFNANGMRSESPIGLSPSKVRGVKAMTSVRCHFHPYPLLYQRFYERQVKKISSVKRRSLPIAEGAIGRACIRRYLFAAIRLGRLRRRLGVGVRGLFPILTQGVFVLTVLTAKTHTEPVLAGEAIRTTAIRALVRGGQGKFLSVRSRQDFFPASVQNSCSRR